MSSSCRCRQQASSNWEGSRLDGGRQRIQLFQRINGSHSSGIRSRRVCPALPTNCTPSSSSCCPFASPRTYTIGFFAPVGNIFGCCKTALLREQLLQFKESGERRESCFVACLDCVGSKRARAACAFLSAKKKPTVQPRVAT